jgi:putative peptidoglycan lipid II flippase
VSFVIKVLIANLVVGVIYAYDYSPVQWYEWGAFDRVLHLTLEILMVVLLYVTTAFLVGMRPRHLLLKGK